MKAFIEFLPPDTSISCFRHEGLKIEAFRSVIKLPYVIVSYENESTSYPCDTIDDARHLADCLINEYLDKVKSVEEFFEEM
ncbi:hypothetical protein [Carnobacterium sp. ISL-102]|uniref:hypothetical protein n=1 Tax=Carnobacterium sp. ISL-102 TaxID=2819142 RepID=UPI001BEBCA1C|nr:hypothetical protein [Carnobacterium sp. ISL-102]MBT2732133.1 hypothetical protein [Carnobacterium sp. ISL-102]